jgi:hypothetical protein
MRSKPETGNLQPATSIIAGKSLIHYGYFILINRYAAHFVELCTSA